MKYVANRKEKNGDSAVFTKATEIFLKWGQLWYELLSLLDFFESSFWIGFECQVFEQGHKQLSVHVSFAPVLLKTDARSGTCRPVMWLRLQHDLKQFVPWAPYAFGKSWDPCGTETGSWYYCQVICFHPVFFVLFVHPSKCFPCGLEPMSRLTACRCKHMMGPTSTSHCVLNCIFSEKQTTRQPLSPRAPVSPSLS